MSLLQVFVGSALVVIGLVAGVVAVLGMGLLVSATVVSVRRGVRTYRVRKFLQQVARDRTARTK